MCMCVFQNVAPATIFLDQTVVFSRKKWLRGQHFCLNPKSLQLLSNGKTSVKVIEKLNYRLFVSRDFEDQCPNRENRSHKKIRFQLTNPTKKE